jgi:hypothetical protein
MFQTPAPQLKQPKLRFTISESTVKIPCNRKQKGKIR